MLNRQIEKSYQEVDRLNCCHQDGRPCCCYDCLKLGFHNEPDEYDCPKKLSYYIGKYAASYTSEIYNYLSKSKIIDQFNNGLLRVLSLGCGFSPDYYAISQYIADNRLNITLEYSGFDNSIHWNAARISYPNLNFNFVNLLHEFRINGFDIVIMNKVFSTIYKHNQENIFLQHLSNAIDWTNGDPLIFIFNDVNSIHMGRNVFDSFIAPKFTSVRQFCTSSSIYKGFGWEILESQMVFPIIPNPEIDPLDEIRQYIFFEYRK
jgi:hypothetical protein